MGRPTHVRYRVLAWACSLSMLTYIDRVCIKNVRSDISRDLGLSDAQFAWVFGAFGLSYALFEVPSGWLGDWFGPRAVLTRIVLWWSVFTALTGLVFPLGGEFQVGYITVSAGFLLLVLVRFLFGVGEAGSYPNMGRALRNWFPYADRGQAQGLLWSCGRWGGAVAPGLVTIAAMPFGWRGAFVTFGIVGALWAIAFGYFFRNQPAEHSAVNAAEAELIQQGNRDGESPPPASWRAMLLSPNLWFLCLMYLCSNAGWCFFITWDVEYYKQTLHLTGQSLNIASGAPLFFGGFGCILGGFVTDRLVRVLGRRWGRAAQGMAAYGVGAAFFVIALLTKEPLIAVPSLCVASFLKDFSLAVNWATCIDMGHRYSGTVGGWMNGVGNLGTFLGPLIVEYLANEGRWELALAFSATMFAIASVCWLFINPMRVIVYAPADKKRLEQEGVL
jgi:ACS family glucarate transporter-like MFS transporter